MNDQTPQDVAFLFINSSGTGRPQNKIVPVGTTVGDFLDDENFEDNVQITVNRNPVDESHVIQQGDRVAISPKKVAMA
jgi:sulfur carrier protein ThiS